MRLKHCICLVGAIDGQNGNVAPKTEASTLTAMAPAWAQVTVVQMQKAA